MVDKDNSDTAHIEADSPRGDSPGANTPKGETIEDFIVRMKAEGRGPQLLAAIEAETNSAVGGPTPESPDDATRLSSATNESDAGPSLDQLGAMQKQFMAFQKDFDKSREDDSSGGPAESDDPVGDAVRASAERMAKESAGALMTPGKNPGVSAKPAPKWESLFVQSSTDMVMFLGNGSAVMSTVTGRVPLIDHIPGMTRSMFSGLPWNMEAIRENGLDIRTLRMGQHVLTWEQLYSHGTADLIMFIPTLGARIITSGANGADSVFIPNISREDFPPLPFDITPQQQTEG